MATSWYQRQTPARRAAYIRENTDRQRRQRAERRARGECVLCTAPAGTKRDGSPSGYCDGCIKLEVERQAGRRKSRADT